MGSSFPKWDGPAFSYPRRPAEGSTALLVSLFSPMIKRFSPHNAEAIPLETAVPPEKTWTAQAPPRFGPVCAYFFFRRDHSGDIPTLPCPAMDKSGGFFFLRGSAPVRDDSPTSTPLFFSPRAYDRRAWAAALFLPLFCHTYTCCNVFFFEV